MDGNPIVMVGIHDEGATNWTLRLKKMTVLVVSVKQFVRHQKAQRLSQLICITMIVR